MNLLESLVDAIVRLEGDALVMHVGEKPYVVTTSAAMSVHRGPIAWGQVELSSRVLTSDAVLGMIAQILPGDLQQSLDAFGAVEHEIALAGDPNRFTVVAARGGDDVWLELKRQARKPAAVRATTTVPEPPADVTSTSADIAQAYDASALEIALPETEAPAHPIEVAPETVEAPVVGEPVPTLSASAAGIGAARDEPAVDVATGRDSIAIEESPAEIESSEMMADETPVSVFKMEMPQAIDLQEAINEIADSSEPAASTATETPVPVSPTAVRTSHESSLVSGDEISRAGDDEPHIQVNVLPEHIEPVQDTVAEYASIVDGAGVQDADALLAATASALLTTTPNGLLPVASETIEPEPIDIAVIHVVEPTARPVDPAPALPAVVLTGIQAAEPPPATPAIEPLMEVAAANTVPVSVVEPPTTASEAVRMSDEREEGPRAVVVPIARTRPETTPGESAPTVDADALLRILRLAANRGASVVYIVAQSRPMVRVDGEISPLEDEAVLTSADVALFINSLGAIDDDGADIVEWLSDVPEVGRVRHLTFHDHRGPGIIFRMIPPRVLSAEQLGLSAEVQALCAQPDGLVIVTGAAMSGKSTLLSAFVDLINRSRSDHVVVIETQIRFVHESHRSFVSQREVRGGSEAVAQAARRALREDPDVLFIEEISSPDVAAVALEAAADGRLVFGSVLAPSATAAIEQLIDSFPAERRAQMRTALAGSLRGVVAQVLLRKLKGGRVAAREVLLNSQAIASLILEGKTVQLPAVLTGRRHGMMPLTDSLAGLVRDGIVHLGEAYRKAADRDALLAALKRDGIDTSFAERLA